MKISFKPGRPAEITKDTAIYLVQENKLTAGDLAKLGTSIKGFKNYIKDREFKGALLSTLTVPSFGAIKPRQVILVGMGKGKLSKRDYYQLGHAMAEALKAGKAKSASLDSTLAYDDAKQFLLGAMNATYDYSLKSDKKKTADINLVLCGRSSRKDNALFAEVRAIHGGVNLTKDLVAAPANYATPKDLAAAARGISRRYKKVKTKIFGPAEIRKHKMGGLLAVSSGSREEPRFIIIEYKGGPASSDPLVFVGKGLTFDAGGISIKPSAGMEGMKWDMGGGGAVIGALEAIAAANYKVNVIGIVPSSENLPDGAAYKPSDVLTISNGTTVEVTNTDAEGRLILADALVYACKYYKPKALVDLATLTGACMMALGNEAGGLMTQDDKLADTLLKVSNDNFDRLWRLPLFESHKKAMKSEIADILNSGPRLSGMSTAAGFLSYFVDEKVSWAHLDIAGMAWNGSAAPGKNKGAGGYGPQLLAAFAKHHAR